MSKGAPRPCSRCRATWGRGGTPMRKALTLARAADVARNVGEWSAAFLVKLCGISQDGAQHGCRPSFTYFDYFSGGAFL